MDTQTKYAPNLEKRQNITNDIFYSRNINKTLDLINENNLTYILITKEMKQGQVWTSNDQGLLFLIRYYASFKNIYDDDNIELWQVL